MDELKHLFGAYFYELWDEHEYRTWEDAVDDFILRSPDRAPQVPQQIDELLHTSLSDQELGVEVVAMGCTFRAPEGDRAWLHALRDRILAAPTA